MARLEFRVQKNIFNFSAEAELGKIDAFIAKLGHQQGEEYVREARKRERRELFDWEVNMYKAWGIKDATSYIYNNMDVIYAEYFNKVDSWPVDRQLSVELEKIRNELRVKLAEATKNSLAGSIGETMNIIDANLRLH